MIPPGKLSQLNNGQRRRKLALCFGSLERDIAGVAEKGHEYHFPSMTRSDYTKKLVEILLTDPDLPQNHADVLRALLNSDNFDERRLCNTAKNYALELIGTFPAEWDLVIAPHKNLQVGAETIEKRDFYSGIYVYCEDIRSPFNLGSIFRTAEAMGAEKVFISPCCVDPNHPRSVRSAMGCIEEMPWARLALDDLPPDEPIFALETGGTNIAEFNFPKHGIVLIGSEELGLSPEALKKCNFGRATIPMKGIKASLNVGVAFGILMQEWIHSIK